MWNCAYPLSLWGLKPAKDWQAVRTKQSKFTPCVLLRTSASHCGNSRMGRLASTKWCSYERSNTQVLRAASRRGCTAGVTLPCPLVGQRQSPCLGSDLPMHVLCGLEGSAQPGRHLEQHPITDGKKNPPFFAVLQVHRSFQTRIEILVYCFTVQSIGFLFSSLQLTWARVSQSTACSCSLLWLLMRIRIYFSYTVL